jgi:phosphatidylglycerol lysyltransferase
VDDAPEPPHTPGVAYRLRTAAVFLLGHVPRVLPFAVVAIVVFLTWDALRNIRPGDVRHALHSLDVSHLWLAALVTVANIAVMGLYDVIAFSHTRSRWFERWRFGAVAFAWSNFLTLGPLAGPAIRFWLYRPSVDRPAELEGGVVSIAISFTSGLAGWTLASILIPFVSPAGIAVRALVAFVLVFVAVYVARLIVDSIERYAGTVRSFGDTVLLALVGWLDWLLATIVFVACVRSTGSTDAVIDIVRSFFIGQAIGLLSLIPGGFGSADAFWVAHLPTTESAAAAALVAYRLVYYAVPWACASLLLLSWVTHRTPRRIELARRVVAGIVAAGGILILVSTATPALRSRLPLLEQVVPLPLVELGNFGAAMTGVLLLALARGLAKGYRAAFRAVVILLIVAGIFSILKGLDWEESVVLTGVALFVLSQGPLFGRASHGDFLEGRDVGVAFVALLAFLVFGLFAHGVEATALNRLTHVGYALERVRFLRTAGSVAIAVAAAGLYLLVRVPVRFTRLPAETVDQALRLDAEIGSDTTPLMVANGDKDVFFDKDDRGYCLYRTIGPYLVVFSDPVVRSPQERPAFLDSLFTFAGEIDRRPVFYQVSVQWIPPLHDRGYAFFKLGEEARMDLRAVSLDGPQGKMYRQILRRAERDEVRLRMLKPYEVDGVMPELRAISDDWLRTKEVRERQFSIGFFDEAYLRHFPLAIVEDYGGRIIAFANVLLGHRRQEMSVDLMRYRSDGPRVMDFLFVSLFLYGKERGFARFNMGMAPLASVGQFRGAHSRERLANLLFQHGEHWYNFQGLRQFKEKFEPEWIPRYMAYQNAWEWPVAIAYTSALIAGGWTTILRGKVYPQGGRRKAGGGRHPDTVNRTEDRVSNEQ